MSFRSKKKTWTCAASSKAQDQEDAMVEIAKFVNEHDTLHIILPHFLESTVSIFFCPDYPHFVVTEAKDEIPFIYHPFLPIVVNHLTRSRHVFDLRRLKSLLPYIDEEQPRQLRVKDKIDILQTFKAFMKCPCDDTFAALDSLLTKLNIPVQHRLPLLAEVVQKGSYKQTKGLYISDVAFKKGPEGTITYEVKPLYQGSDIVMKSIDREMTIHQSTLLF